MNLSKLLLASVILITAFSCNQNESKESNQMADVSSVEMAEVVKQPASTYVSSSAAVETGKDSSRRFIRTADLKFKVQDVIKSTYDIEAIALRQNGFVEYTNLTSEIDNVNSIAVSADSSLETTYYTVTNALTIRVPNTQLDSTLKEIARNIQFLDYRIIKARDVALEILTNNLTKKRVANTEERLKNAIDNRGKKLEETTDAEELLISKQEQADNAAVANLTLQDQIKFSTITLSIYQRQAIKRELLPNNKNITEYEPGFGSKLISSLKEGWEILESFIVSLTKLWALILFAFALYLLYKVYKNRKK